MRGQKLGYRPSVGIGSASEKCGLRPGNRCHSFINRPGIMKRLSDSAASRVRRIKRKRSPVRVQLAGFDLIQPDLRVFPEIHCPIRKRIICEVTFVLLGDPRSVRPLHPDVIEDFEANHFPRSSVKSLSQKGNRTGLSDVETK